MLPPATLKPKELGDIDALPRRAKCSLAGSIEAAIDRSAVAAAGYGCRLPRRTPEAMVVEG